MKKKYLFLLLILLIVSLISLSYLFFFISPQTEFNLPLVNLPSILLFFPSIFIFLFSLITFITRRPIFGTLVASAVVLYLLLRLFGLTHPFFLFLLIALFIILILALRKEKPEKR